MTPQPVAAEHPAALLALQQRLRAVAPELLAGADDDLPPDDGQAVAELLRRLVAGLAERPERDRVWLLLVALSAAFPLAADVRAAQRQLELASVSESTVWLLEWAHPVVRSRQSAALSLELIVNGVVVDVDFTARNDHATGIQRVVRRLAPRWHRDHDMQIVVWTDHDGGYRHLDRDEQERALHWVRPLRRPAQRRENDALVVPWRSTVVLPEVPGREQCRRLAALAEHSGNRVSAIGYDAIPVLSADLMPETEPNRFVTYLTLVKHLDVVVGISAAAAAEFRGFAAALPSQGLSGPRVVACPLASDAPATEAGPPQGTNDPEVVVVGSHEPRKNHLAVLHAAEVLWREGLRFRVRFLGAGGWTTEAFDAELERLSRRGRAVVAERGLDDEQLWAAYRRARFSVFPSLHEGYGLPVVESLSLGTPVVATCYGSTAELAADGGVLLVDPRDDDDVVGALRSLLIDDALLAELRQQALQRPVRTWDDYAHEAWQHLVRAR